MQLCYNGEFLPVDKPVVFAESPGFKWGEGLFETMRFWNGKLMLESLHFERLFTGMALLQLEDKTGQFRETIKQNIIQLCSQNNCTDSARVRLALFRDADDSTSYIIEAASLCKNWFEWKEEGLMLELFRQARKSIDAFSNLKSANYLPYSAAARFAQIMGVDDALVLNADGAVCDSSKANIFLVKKGKLLTPSLHEGCIGGVMRRVVIQKSIELGYEVFESRVMEVDVLNADEVFLTNAIQIIRWVRQYQRVSYVSHYSKRIFEALLGKENASIG